MPGTALGAEDTKTRSRSSRNLLSSADIKLTGTGVTPSECGDRCTHGARTFPAQNTSDQTLRLWGGGGLAESSGRRQGLSQAVCTQQGGPGQRPGWCGAPSPRFPLTASMSRATSTSVPVVIYPPLSFYPHTTLHPLSTTS